MQKFTFYTPTEVVFGKGAEDNTAKKVKQYGGSKVLVVYGGGSVKKSGLLDRITETLQAEKITYEILGGVQPNPRLGLAREGVAQARKMEADFILAIGGGSVIDTAKGIAHGAANPETDIWDFWLGKAKVTKSLPVGVILTISAAGSEMSDSAVLTNEETGEKCGLGTSFNRPRFAVMNPELTFSLPTKQVACGIVDIMMHTLDRYFTHTKENELTDEIAEAVLRVTIKNGIIAMNDHHNYAAMSELMWCGSVSHNGITGLGAVVDFAPHKLGHELSGKFDVAHGASLSTIWGAWAKYVYVEEPERFARYADKVWGIQKSTTIESALEGIEATVAYFKSIEMPTCFTELSIGVQDEAVLTELADRCTGHGKGTIANFKKLNREDIYKIYQSANC